MCSLIAAYRLYGRASQNVRFAIAICGSDAVALVLTNLKYSIFAWNRPGATWQPVYEKEKTRWELLREAATPPKRHAPKGKAPEV